ncbi:MAG: nuclear transport factor 2 family protein [Chakrabartia sp.]
MTADVIAITQLLYRYGAMMDAGDFDGAAGLLAAARVRLGKGQDLPGSAMAQLWRDRIILYPCGTPRTQHIITNPIVDIDASGRAARCTSLYTVYQQTPDLPLQIIAGGRYEDVFERGADGWRFSFRDYTQFNFTGQLGHHLRDIAA